MTVANFPFSPRRFPWLYLTGAVVAFGLAGYAVPGVTEAQLAWYNDDFGFFLLAAIISVACFRRTSGATGLEERRMWRWLAASMACWATAELGESLIPGLKSVGISGLPSTLLFTLAYGAWLLATVEAPHRRSGWTTDQPGWKLERWGVMVFIIGIVADLVVIPQIAVPGSALPSSVSSALFLAFDIAFLARLAGLRSRSQAPAWRRWYGVLAIVAILWVCCDAAAALILLGATSGWPGPWYDLFWYSPMLALAYACELPTAQPPREDRAAHTFAERAAADGNWSLESCLAVLTPAFVFIHLIAGLTPLVPAAAAGWRAISAIGFLLLLGVLLLRRQAGLERQVRVLGLELHDTMEALASQERLNAVARLAGGVAHNFNNLLMVILGHGELLRGRLGRQESVTEDVGRIEDAAQRAARLTADLLAFGGQQPIVPRTLSVNELLDVALDELRGIAGPGVSLSTLCGERIPPVQGDAALLRTALGHLVDHARQRLDGAGSLTITTAPLELAPGTRSTSLIPAGHYVRLSVEDDGPPLRPEEQEQLFEPFSGPVAEEVRLGLAAVRGIVWRHNGYILVHTGPGQGLRFDLLFPVVAEATIA